MNPDGEPAHQAQKGKRFCAPLRPESGGQTLRVLPAIAGALWYSLPTLTVRAPDRLPQLEVTPPEHHGYGRPRTSDTDPERVECAAILHDLAGWSFYKIAHAGNGADARHTAGKRDVERGRQRLREHGVLPWAVFNGELPPDWLYTPTFSDVIRQWRYEAVPRALSTPEGKSMGALIRLEFKRNQARRDVDLTPWVPLPREGGSAPPPAESG